MKTSSTALVMMWLGHGRPGADESRLRLLAHDSPNTPSGGLDAVEFARGNPGLLRPQKSTHPSLQLF
jgi:hypothetical protein